jgi:hypothetical protein
MAKFTPLQVEEINAVIAEIEKKIKPESEIGALDKSILSPLLAANNIKTTPSYFKCKREYSDEIVSYFVKTKSLKKSKFHRNGQSLIFLL